MEKFYSFYESPLGEINMVSDGGSLIGLWFRFQRGNLEYAEMDASLPVFDDTRRWLDIYFSGRDPEFMPELKLECSPFRKRVCEIMLTIPYGHTMTYGEIAKEIASEKGLKRMSAQAVGGAVGHNPISLIIPCHRVIGANNCLVGYAGGVDKKAWLLRHEGVDVDSMAFPPKHLARFPSML